MVNFLFYSAEDLVHFAVVFFVVAADLANERHQYKETPTDNRNHNLISHVMCLAISKFGLSRPIRTRSRLVDMEPGLSNHNFRLKSMTEMVEEK